MDNNSKFEQSFKVNLMIWFVFFISMVMYVFVMEYVGFKNSEENSGVELIFYVFLAMGAIQIVLIPIVKQYFFNKNNNDATLRKVTLEDKLGNLQKGSLIVFALIESICLYGFSLAFLSRSRLYFYIFVSISFIAMILNFPNKDKWKEAVGDLFYRVDPN